MKRADYVRLPRSLRSGRSKLRRASEVVSRRPFYVMGSHVVPQKFSQTIKLIRESKIAKMPDITLLPMTGASLTQLNGRGFLLAAVLS